MYGEVVCAARCSGPWRAQRTKMPILDEWLSTFGSLLSGLHCEISCFKAFRLLNLNLYVNLSSWRELLCLWKIRLYLMSLCCCNFLKKLFALLKRWKVCSFVCIYPVIHSPIHSSIQNKYIKSIQSYLDAMNKIETVAPYTLVGKLRTTKVTHELLKLQISWCLTYYLYSVNLGEEVTSNTITFHFVQNFLVILDKHTCMQ